MRIALPLYLVATILGFVYAGDAQDEVCPALSPILHWTAPKCPAADAPKVIPPAEEQDLPGFEEWKRLQESPEEPTPTPLPSEPALTPSPSHTERPISNHKYNYASPDCGARVHSSSKLSQHASSVLHKSRDRYMLTPCKAGEHWVTIELCDEVRVEAVEIAVWEFFSGIVREVRVSAGEEGEQVEVGTFVGKNVRGVQVSQS